MFIAIYRKNYIKIFYKTVAKTCKKILLKVEHGFNNTNLAIKVKVENFPLQLKSQITKQLLTPISVDKGFTHS